MAFCLGVGFKGEREEVVLLVEDGVSTPVPLPTAEMRQKKVAQ